MIRVLFVCLGNICRSPLAEGHFQKLIEDNNLQGKISCDSAGTGSWHVGELSDSRTRENAENHGLILTHRARQLKTVDLKNFDYILAMDDSNHQNILYLKNETNDASAKIFLMRHFDPMGVDKAVPDPYSGGPDAFENVFKILERSTKSFLEYLIKEENL